MKKFFLLALASLFITTVARSQVVFFEDFSSGEYVPDGWTLKNTDTEGYTIVRLAESSWSQCSWPEFNFCFYEGIKANLSQEDILDGIEMISPVLNLSSYDYLNFAMDFYRLEKDICEGDMFIHLSIRNSHMTNWKRIYTQEYKYITQPFGSKPFICSIDSSIFKGDGFQFKIEVLLSVADDRGAKIWFTMDNVRVFVPCETDMAIFDKYPNLHIEPSQAFKPRIRLLNTGVRAATAKVNCFIREHLSNEIVFQKQMDIPEMERMDTLTLSFPETDLPYNNHLYHVEYTLECTGDTSLSNNYCSYDIDTYSTSFHNPLGLNLFYSCEYSFGIKDDDRYLFGLKTLIDSLELIKNVLPSSCVVNYIYDDAPDSLDVQTAISFMGDHGIAYTPGEPDTCKGFYIPRFSLFPRKEFRVFFNLDFFNITYGTIYKRIIDFYRSPFTLDIYGTHTGLDYNVMVELTPKAPIVNDRLKLRTVITRSHVPSNANSEIPEYQRVGFFDDVVQMALPDTNGIAFAMDGSETSAKQWEMSFSLKDFWDPEQVKIVTYVQDTLTYDILQCRAVNLQNLWGVGMEEEAQTPAESVLISPNPAKDMLYAQLMLEMPANVDFRLFDINGRDLGILKRSFLGAGNHKVQINVPKHIKTGIYILQTETEREVYSQKLNIVR